MYNLKHVKNTHWGVLLLAKLQASAYKFTKRITPSRVFYTFLKMYQIAQSVINVSTKILKVSSFFMLPISYWCWEYWKASLLYKRRVFHYPFNPLNTNPPKWSNTLKQFIGYCQRIVWVCLTILGVGVWRVDALW